MEDWFLEAIQRMKPVEPMLDKLYPYQRAALEALTKEPGKISFMKESPPCKLFAAVDTGDSAATTLAVVGRTFGKSVIMSAMAKAGERMRAEHERMTLDLLDIDVVDYAGADCLTVFDLKRAVDSCLDKVIKTIEPVDEAATPNPARRLAPAELREIHQKNRAPRKGRRHGKR